MDRDKLKDKVAEALERYHDDNVFNEYWEMAEAAFSAIEASGYVLMPKDQILRKMSKDEFSELMAGVKFKEPSDG